MRAGCRGSAPASRRSSCRGCDGETRYDRRRPEESVLYGVVQAELETFLTRAEARERPVPRFVERELRGFLRCGILAHGFVRVHCDACGLDRVVAFSCKSRGSSCGGRRMADVAAHLVERVLPQVPVRQWVLSLPFALRYRLGYDAGLTSAVLSVVRCVFASLRRRARRQRGVARGQGGAVSFVQRFGDALNLNTRDGGPGPEFERRIDDLDAFLGERSFLFAERLSRADLSVFAALHGMAAGLYPNARELLVARPRLLAHHDRVDRATAG